MLEQFVYPANIKTDKKGFFLVTFPDFPEAATDGKTVDEALTGAMDCLEEAVAGRIRRGDDIPRPSPKKRNQALVAVPAQMAVKAALYLAVKEAGITRTALAGLLESDEKEVRRMLDPRHPSKLPRMEAALEALGKHLVIGIKAA